MNMTDEQKTMLEDLKARQDAGEHMPCPRCGRDTMDAEPMHNALSRHADLFICASCGMAESFLDMKQNLLPFKDWACFIKPNPEADAAKSLPATELLSRVMTGHIQYLTTLYERWQDEHEYEDFDEYRDAAKDRCPGLTELWPSPFRAEYQAADGKVVVRFRSKADKIEVAADIVR